MRKKFKNIENDEEFKNFKLEDYLPSMNRREPVEKFSEPEPGTTAEATTLFPPMDEPDTSAIQESVSEAMQPDGLEELETSDMNEGIKELPAGLEVAAERTIARRISSKQRRLSLDEYRTTYLQVPKIADRKPVFVSREVRDRLDRIVRTLGDRGMSVSGLVENLARQHLAAYGNDINQWRKL